MHGKGVFYDQFGNVYEGEFENDIKQGYGIQRGKGDVTEGAWMRGALEGLARVMV
jgi:hypothetical protein